MRVFDNFNQTYILLDEMPKKQKIKKAVTVSTVLLSEA